MGKHALIGAPGSPLDVEAEVKDERDALLLTEVFLYCRS